MKTNNMNTDEEATEKKDQTSNTQNPSYNTGKGTGMSSEAGSTQSEKSWQDKSGSDTNWQTGDSRNEIKENSTSGKGMAGSQHDMQEGNMNNGNKGTDMNKGNSKRD